MDSFSIEVVNRLNDKVKKLSDFYANFSNLMANLINDLRTEI